MSYLNLIVKGNRHDAVRAARLRGLRFSFRHETLHGETVGRALGAFKKEVVAWFDEPDTVRPRPAGTLLSWGEIGSGPPNAATKVFDHLEPPASPDSAMWAFATRMVERHGMNGDGTMTDDDHALWQAASGAANAALKSSPDSHVVHTTTRDLGFALRDHLEGKKVCHLEDDRETGWSADVDHVDISDASNPIVYMTNGRSFQVRIIWKGDRP